MFQRNFATEERPGVPPSGSRALPHAPCLVPSHGHAALIPDASGHPCVPGLRAALAQGQWGVVGVTCCSLQRTTLFSLSRSARTVCACVLTVVCEP